jgi:hypothetical protein
MAEDSSTAVLEAPADAAPSVPEWSTLVNTLPEDLRKEPTIQQLKDLPTAMKSLVDAQKYAGGAVRIPKGDAKPEEWQAFHRKLGVPETPQGYSVTKPELADGVGWDQGSYDQFLVEAHKAGLTPSQVQAVLNVHAQVVGRQVEQGYQAARDHAQSVEEELRREYGGAYDRNIALAHRAVKHLGGDETLAYLEETGLGNHPGLIKAFVQAGQMLAEDRHISGDVDGLMGPQQAKDKWESIQADPKHAYWDATNPGHEAAVREVERLFQIQYS